MKTIKLLFSGLLLFGVTSFICQASDIGLPTGTLGSLLTSSSSTSTSSSSSSSTTVGALTGTENYTDFLAKFQSYMDTSEISAFMAAYQADQAASSPKTFNDFFLDYCGSNPTFYANVVKAIDKVKESTGASDAVIITQLKQKIEDMKKQIEDMKNLPDDEKTKYKELLDKQAELADKLTQQLGNANNAVAQAIQAAANKPQEQDPMQQMLPMLMMMMMMMMQKGGGGGGSPCGG